jgi:hypothetical protein
MLLDESIIYLRHHLCIYSELNSEKQILFLILKGHYKDLFNFILSLLFDIYDYLTWYLVSLTTHTQ